MVGIRLRAGMLGVVNVLKFHMVEASLEIKFHLQMLDIIVINIGD